MANPMEPRFIGLPAGPPWHFRGSGPEVAGTGATAAAPPGRARDSDSPTSVQAFEALCAVLRLQGALGSAFVR
eukprot:13462061-Alexandrium_andersonii.AAC.1